jgi:hypothetical protein
MDKTMDVTTGLHAKGQPGIESHGKERKASNTWSYLLYDFYILLL